MTSFLPSWTQIGTSALAGGITAELTGGNFWEGAATGATIGLLNHAMHGGDDKSPWDKNGDGKLSKKEADYWWLHGNGVEIIVDGNLINLEGFDLSKATSNANGDIYCYDTVDAFRYLPWETAETYGGSCFNIVDGVPQMRSQEYHYNMRDNNNAKNLVRNVATKIGTPRIPKGVTPKDYFINIKY